MDVELQAGKLAVTRGDWSDRARRSGSVLAAAGAAVLALATFLPWIRTGQASRSSFGMVRSADLLGLVHGPAVLGLRAWYLVPVLVAVLWLAAVSHHRPLVIGVGAILGLTALLVALIVESTSLSTGFGPRLAVLGAVLTLAGVTLTIFEPRGSR